MLNAGMMQKSDLLSVRDEMEESFNAVGDTMIQSIGVAYAIQCDKDAGIDVDHIQTSYLWAEGLRMIGLALLMGVATVLVGLFASKVAAGVGMNLREGLFKKVVGFSNAEMDHFSTASLITRSTNDVQQIQMVHIRIAALLGRDDPALAAHQLEAFVPLLRAFAARHAVHRVVALFQLDAGEAVEIRAVRLDAGL